MTLLVNISAPEKSGLNYETESYYISRALHDHVGVVVNEMGELEDLLTGLQSEPPPLGVHFSGHGGPGILLFEDAEGGECPVPLTSCSTISAVWLQSAFHGFSTWRAAMVGIRQHS